MLTGTYYFRQVYYVLSGQYANGSLADAAVAYGNITFSGTGTYSMTGTFLEAASGGSRIGPVSGTYSIAASGYGFLTNPITGDAIYGLVNQQGIFVGSDTETQSGYNDLFVAAPVGSTPASTSTFKGSYSVAFLDLSSGNPGTALNAMLQMNPDGAGNLGTVAVNGYVGQSGSQKYTQSLSGVKYIFSNGAGVATFPNSNTAFLVGQYYIYISPDGNFIFGGSPSSFDMFVGVRTGTAPTLSGLYYQAGVDEDESNLAAGYALLDTYYGAFKAASGSISAHQRVVDLLTSGGPIDYTYTDAYSAATNGAYSTAFMNYAIGTNGMRVGAGIGPYLGINVALPEPPLSGSGVFLDPTGILNAASFAPFTAGVAPGELLTLYGTNLASGLVVASDIPFPTTLGGVQVMVNGVAAPIYYVSPGQISAIVPYATSGAIAQVQVINNSVQSNSVTMWIGMTAPGIFTPSNNGLGYAAFHQDGTLVSSKSPAAIGETVSVYATGLGTVSPAISDGAAGPSGTLSNTVNTIAADIGGTAATVTYAGLAPGLAGLYQVNVTVPSGVASGDNALDLAGPDSYTSQVLISVGSSTPTSSASPSAMQTRRVTPRAYSPSVSTRRSTSSSRTRTSAPIAPGLGRSSKP